MEPMSDIHRLRRRRSDLAEAIRWLNGVGMIGKRELYVLRDSIQEYSVGIRAIIRAPTRSHRSVGGFVIRDFEMARQVIRHVVDAVG
jgi:hypothetical protein